MIKTMRRLGAAFFSFACLAAIVHSQDFSKAPEPTTIPAFLRSSHVSSDSDALSVSVAGEDGNVSWSTSGYSAESSSNKVELKPGKRYEVNLSGLSSDDTYSLGISAPSGYISYISQPGSIDTFRARDRVSNSGMTGAGVSISIRIESIADALEGYAFGASNTPDAQFPGLKIGLGKLSNGKSAGVINFRIPDLRVVEDNPGDFYYTPPSEEVSVKYDTSGRLSQINGPSGLVNFTITASRRYEIEFYDWKDVVVSGSNWSVAGGASPVATYEIWRDVYDYVWPNWEQVGWIHTSADIWQHFKKTVGQTYWHSAIFQDSTLKRTSYDWVKNATPAESNYVSKTEVNYYASGGQNEFGWDEDFYGRRDGQVHLDRRYRNIYKVIDGATRLLSRYVRKELGALDFTLLEDRDYYEGGSFGAGHQNRLRGIWYPNDSEVEYTYYDDFEKEGLVKEIFTTFGDDTDRIKTVYSYTNSNTFGYYLPSEIVSYDGTTVISKTGYSYDEVVRDGNEILKTTVQEYSSGSSYQTTVNWVYRDSVSDPELRGRLYAVKRPDGTQSSYEYANATIDVVFAGQSESLAATRVSEIAGSSSSPSGLGSAWSLGSYNSSDIENIYVVDKQSTLSRTWVTEYGVAVKSEVLVCDGGSSSFSSAGRVEHLFDSRSRLIESRRYQGSSASAQSTYKASYLDGQLEWEEDAAGLRREFGYDDSGRLDYIWEPGKPADSYGAQIEERNTFLTLDGAGNTVRREVTDGSGSEIVASSWSYDTGGRLISKTLDCCDTVTYSYPSKNRTTITNADNGVIHKDYWFDGSLKEVSGDGAAPLYQKRDYDSSTGVLITQTGHAPFTNGDDSVAGYSQVRSDFLGRTLSTEVKNDTGGSTYYRNEYSTKGQLAKSLASISLTGSPIKAPKQFVYDDLGRLELEGYSLSDSVLSASDSDDRLTRYASGFEKDSSGVWWSFLSTYAYPNSSVGSTGVFVSKVSNVVIPAAGYLSHHTVEDQHDNLTETKVALYPAAGIAATWTTVKPKNASSFNTAWDVAKLGYRTYSQDAAGARIDYSYDSLRRLSRVQERGAVKIGYTYYNGSNRIYQEGTVNSSNALNVTKTRNYQHGRLKTETRRNKFDGQSEHSEAVSYDYDKRGNVTLVSGSGAYPVRYEYDSQNRRRFMKQYQDGNLAGSDYAVTEWTYDAITGLNKTKKIGTGSSYNDKDTYYYDEMGRLEDKVMGAGAAVNYVYSTAGQYSTGDLLEINYTDTYEVGPTADVDFLEYDRMGRPTKINDATGQRTFAYDKNSGLSLGVENLDNGFYGSNDITQAYETAGSGKVAGRYSQSVYAGVTFKQDYDAYNGRLKNVAISGPFSQSFYHVYHADSNRLRYSSYSSPSSRRNVRSYESARNVLQSVTLENNDDYEYAEFRCDDVTWQGQRQDVSMPQGRSFTNLFSSSAVTHQSQYDQRGQLTSWNTTRTSGNDASYSWDTAGNPTSFDGLGFTSANDENQVSATSGGSYSYNAYGNPWKMGDWRYWHSGDEEWLWGIQYDAEGRVTRMRSSILNLSMEFAYDYMGRRVEKKVWDNKWFSGNPDDHLKFVYQGRELVAELDENGNLRKTFHWGLDKSDTRGGAGGAMGLLMWRDHVSNQSYYPVYDLNGNLAGLRNSSNSWVAWYEYDAFGNVLTSGGSMADANPIGFSTQYTDRESGFVYYGLRYYNTGNGRFLTRDPIGEAGGNNLYRFVDNDPVNSVDVWGLKKIPRQIVPDEDVTELDDFSFEGPPPVKIGSTGYSLPTRGTHGSAGAGITVVQAAAPGLNANKDQKENDDKKDEKSDCEKFVDELVDLAQFDTPWYSYLNERASVGYGMMAASWYDQRFWNGTQYHPGLGPGQLGGGNGTRVNYPVTGFRPELVDHGQNSDVMKHVLGHAGAQIANSPVSIGAAYLQNRTDQNQADAGRQQSQVELLNNQVGRDVGRSMVNTINGSQSKADLKNDLMGKLCAPGG